MTFDCTNSIKADKSEYQKVSRYLLSYFESRLARFTSAILFNRNISVHTANCQTQLFCLSQSRKEHYLKLKRVINITLHKTIFSLQAVKIIKSCQCQMCQDTNQLRTKREVPSRTRLLLRYVILERGPLQITKVISMADQERFLQAPFD